jgi:delta(3,5)-delta(2,4)-dienoyl-CoA isomerase
MAADLGTLALLPKITSNDSLVRELAYTARPFSSSEAEKLGFISKLVPGSRDEVVSAALDLAHVISKKSPIAVYSSKALIRHAMDHRWVEKGARFANGSMMNVLFRSIQENLDYTSLWNAMMLQTPVCPRLHPFRNGPRSSFSCRT